MQRYPVDFIFIKICDRVTGQHDRQWNILSGQIAISGRTLSVDRPLFPALKLEEEEFSVQIASSVCGTNVTSQIKAHGILTARFEYHFFGTKRLNFKSS